MANVTGENLSDQFLYCVFCKEFGHIEGDCSARVVCGRCGQNGHNAVDCQRKASAEEEIEAWM